MLIAPRAAGGAAGPKLRPENPARVRLAGRREGGIHLRGTTGLGGAAHSAGKNGGAGRGKKKSNVSQIICKIGSAN